jgi:hypothetical protein
MTIEHYTTTAAVFPATDIGFQDVHDGKRIELGKREIRIVLVALEPIELVSSWTSLPHRHEITCTNPDLQSVSHS